MFIVFPLPPCVLLLVASCQYPPCHAQPSICTITVVQKKIKKKNLPESAFFILGAWIFGPMKCLFLEAQLGPISSMHISLYLQSLGELAFPFPLPYGFLLPGVYLH